MMNGIRRCIARPLRRFADDRRGGMAVWFGLSLVPLIVVAGSGVDIARGVSQQAQLQSAVDAAALAGAGAYTSAATLLTAEAVATNYMNNFKSSSGLSSLQFTISPGTRLYQGTVSAYTMQVNASSPVQNSLTKMFQSSNTTSARAIAQNGVYNVTVSASNFSSSAIDTNAVYYYIVPSDGSTPTNTTLLYTNALGASNSSSARTIPITASQQIGFMLLNTTDGNATQTCTTQMVWTWYGWQQQQSCTSNSYGNNGYGGTPGSVHRFYSHMMPPSKIAYPNVTQNCSLRVSINSSAAPSTGCLNSLPTGSTVNCIQQSGNTLYYWWNDMGGPKDDKDFNDAGYQVTCSRTDPNASRGLVLTN